MYVHHTKVCTYIDSTSVCGCIRHYDIILSDIGTCYAPYDNYMYVNGIKSIKKYCNINKLLHNYNYVPSLQVEVCRARLLVMEGGTEEVTPQPTAAWKKACRTCILPKVHKSGEF